MIWETIVGIATIVGALAILPTSLSWWETRRLGKRRSSSDTPTPNHTPFRRPTRTLDCGIFDYPPLSSFPASDPDTPVGPLVDLIKSIAHDLALPLKFNKVVENLFVEGKTPHDIIVGMLKTLEREKYFLFSRPFYQIGLQGICRQSETGDLLSRIREGSLKVALYKGEVGWEYAERELRGRNRRVIVLEYGHRMETMAMLTAGIYDIVLMDSLSCAHFIKTSRTRQFKLAFNEPLEKYHSCVALKKAYEYLLPFIDAALDKQRNSPHFLWAETNALTGYENIVFKQGIHD